MEKSSKHVILPCDCKCCMFVIEKTTWEDGSVDYDISIQDSRYDHNYNTAWGRVKRAFASLFGKPVYYSDVYINDVNKMRKLVKDIEELIENDN